MHKVNLEKYQKNEEDPVLKMDYQDALTFAVTRYKVELPGGMEHQLMIDKDHGEHPTAHEEREDERAQVHRLL